jgi:hypothetical protein
MLGTHHPREVRATVPCGPIARVARNQLATIFHSRPRLIRRPQRVVMYHWDGPLGPLLLNTQEVRPKNTLWTPKRKTLTIYE